MTQIEVLINSDPDLLPTIGNPGDAGYDLRAAVDIVLEPGDRALVPTGVRIAIPNGYVGLVHPRSGLAVKNGITVLNAPGTIDSGYRGEIMVPLINHSREQFSISRGDRIAQIIFQAYEQVRFIAVAELPGSQRGSQGFGSTGVK
ncbi:MAG: dUTP diphosphatase [Acidobacteria bacterium]|nr:dUTP diphosphatase [Acidobacteriota bacterium]